MLTSLIRDETDRIISLIDRMELFSDGAPLEREPVNIHAVLERVRVLAQSGPARARAVLLKTTTRPCRLFWKSRPSCADFPESD